MPLTPAEQQELDAINAQLGRMDEEEKGAKAADQYSRGRAVMVTTPPPKPRPFSLWRATVGGVRDAIQGATDTLDDIDAWSDRLIGLRHEDNPLAYRPQLPHLQGEENAGTAERVSRGIVSFVVPFTAGMKILRGVGALGTLGRAAQGVGAGVLADFSQVDPVSGNLATVLKDTFKLDNKVLNSIASEDDDTALESRFKASVGGAIPGIIGEGLFALGGRTLRYYRDWKGTAEEAKGVVDSIKKGAIELDDPTLPVRVEQPKAAGGAKGAKAGKEDIPVVEADAVYDPVPESKVMVERTPETWEDVVDFLKRKSADPGIDPEFSSRLAKNLLEGDPENALAKLGIDPAKLDYSVFTDPERLGRLQKGLEEIFLPIAQGLGRTGIRVTGEATARGAEALASTPDVLKILYGNTSNLAETLMAARMFVGGHARQMLALAEAATTEIERGGAGEAWSAFLEAFHRHAYFLGALRGAGTEIGRALSSLQRLAKAAPTDARRVLSDALAKDATAEAAQQTGKHFTVERGASAYADRLVTDAEKLAALTKLKALRGDVSELSRSVREGAGSRWKRFNLAIKETLGSLFTTSTAVYNVGAGAVVLSLNSLGRLLSAVARTPALAVGGRSAFEARRAWTEAWAYTDGIMGGFREAYRNTISVLEHEGYSELAINLDGLGLHDLARKAATKSGKEYADAAVRFERADVVNNKAFALTTSEAQRLHSFISDTDAPKFFELGLRGLSKVLAGSINAAGSLYRTGTTLFINAPDEFIGTLSTRAGAYAKAVNIAAHEAADMGLEGGQLSTYLKARTVQLFGDGPAGWAAGGFEEGGEHALLRAGETEARAVLFQDDLEVGINRWLSDAVSRGGGMASLIIPFIKTPLRILERTAIDYSPLGLFKERIRSALAAGGAARDEAMARMSLGMTAVFLGYQLAEDRQIVGYDGGFTSTARDAGRPMYSLKIGDDVYEFSRLDPIGTLLGMGADVRTLLDANEDDPDAPQGASELTEAFLWATAANVLSKSWLTSIRQLTDLAGATSAEDADTRWEKFKTGLATRFIPGSGVQRQIEAWGDDQLREAASFSDGLLKSSLGASKLPVRRDIVGRPMMDSGMHELAGIRGNVMSDPQTDRLGAELESLSFRRPTAQRTQKGVKLDATQFSRFLEIRGREVRDPQTGLTLEETLNTLVALPEYQSLTKRARIEEIRKAMDGFTGSAVDQLTNEDHTFALARLKVEVYDQAALQGWDNKQRDDALKSFADKLGIPHE